MPQPSKLLVIWSSADPEVAVKMTFMYALNAKKHGWWDQVRLCVWGPSALLASQNPEIQDQIKKMKQQGVELLACKACADMYGVADMLSALGINVIYMGQPLTEMLKTGWTTLTF